MPVDDRERKTAGDIDLYEYLKISMNQMALYESNGSLFIKSFFNKCCLLHTKVFSLNTSSIK
jgi:hypothetical protein